MSQREDSSLGVTPLVTRGAQSAFDIRKEADVIDLLRLVHINAIEPDVQNHLRDLIFAYRQTLTEEDGKKVGDAFMPLRVTVMWSDAAATSSAPQKKESVVQDKMGMGRPTPRFFGAVKETPAAPHRETQAPFAATEQKSMSAAEVSIPVAPPVEALHTPNDASERIKEIKRLVNEKVGNPVNLIETHEGIGREYMSALLDAMKKSNGAQGGELHLAMDRLELAFKHVQEIAFGEKAPSGPMQKEVATSAAPASDEIKMTEKAEKAEAASAPEPGEPIPKEAVETPTNGNMQQASSMVHAQEREELYVPLSVSSEGRPPERPLRINTINEESSAPLQSAEMEAKPATLANESAQAPAFVQQEPANAFMSVAKEKQIQDLLRANKEKEGLDHKREEEARIEQMDPLFAPDVTNGLNQLLSEWKLFKSSGLLGTGPKGKDHPLYKRLSSLTMAAVIAGRFEGANAAVKQSITDYMNGWRYEEGVVHDHGETFENYLRRVVRRILSRKQAK
jgi:hypothetical protein